MLREWTLELRPAESAPAAARDEIATRMAARPDDVTTDVQLLVSELVTNALRHAGLDSDDRIFLKLSESQDSVRVEVCDPGRGESEPRASDKPGLRGGFGLWLVNQISSRWGVRRNARRCVWFEMPLA